MKIPTFEEIGDNYNILLYYNCKTAQEWQNYNPNIKIIDPCGFPNNTLNTERMSWYDFVVCRDNSVTEKTNQERAWDKEEDLKNYK